MTCITSPQGNIMIFVLLCATQPSGIVQSAPVCPFVAFKAFYKQERKSKSEGQQSLVPPVVLGAASEEDNTAWGMTVRTHTHRSQV